MTISLIYVSRSRLPATRQNEAIGDIVATSIVRNGREDITGALLFSGTHFVQILEGPADPVGQLMDDIRRDPRHTDVEVLEAPPIKARRFGDWRMAYVGDAIFVRAYVQDLLDARGDRAWWPLAVKDMRDLMRRLVDAGR